MQLIGFLDSPYVRRVAVSMQFLGIGYQHRELSIWRDYDEFRRINPLVKVPTLVCDDGRVLVDSTLIIDYLETRVAGGRGLMPDDPEKRCDASQFIGTALIAMEKSVQLIYEKQHRPSELQHGAWIHRLTEQLDGAVLLMESSVRAADLAGQTWLTSDQISQADISTAIAWRFMQHTSAVDLDPAAFPALSDYSDRAESLSEFKACPLSG